MLGITVLLPVQIKKNSNKGFTFAHGPLLAEVKRSGKNPEAGNAMASKNTPVH